MFDLNHTFIAAYAEHFVESRLESGRRYRYGQPGPAVAIMSACAGALRRLAAYLDRWAAGSPAGLPDVVRHDRSSVH